MAINVPIITTFADKGISAAEKAFGKFGKTGAAVGAAFAASTALVVAGLGKAVNAAIEDQKSQALLAKQLENTTGASRMTIAATEDFITQMQFATGVADDALRPALGSLVRATNDLTVGQDLLNLAMNVSAGTGRDLETVSLALGKAYNGNLGGLTKLGIALDPNIIKTKDFGAAQAELTKQFGGAAAAAANTYEGQLKRLGIVFAELNETIGYAILNNRYVKDAINRLPDAAAAAIAAFGEKGLKGALSAFLDEMGIVGAYTKKWGLSIAYSYNKMAMHAYNALTLVTLGLIQIIPAIRKAGDEINANLLQLQLEIDATTYYITDLNNALNVGEQAQRANGAAADRLSGQAEALGYKLAPVVEQLDKVGGAAKKADTAVSDAAKALQDDLTKALDAAKTGLDDAQSAFNGFAESVSTGLQDAFSFKDAKDAGDDTGKGFLSGLRDQVAGINRYSADVEALLKAGLSQDALQAVLAAGGESGAAIAAELIKGGSNAIIETNALVESAKYAADLIGQSAAQQWYGAGVSNAQQYLKGVEAAFAVAQARLAGKGLKLADVKGISAGFSDAISAPAAAPISPPSFNYGDPFGMKGVTVNVSGGISTSAEIGEAVVNAIRAYNRAAGPANIAVA
ncbi:hypothetical protein UFOVP1395_10 [uncultured Caudovirales phage]|uniref:Bacteriophage tail tape measure N-terminal domain-containing protein n=1 Tax=uncultured Caudovirales phage TaxID=2100421 RepID=A0A6J5RLR6_9CAUD|nr:hypothetical protein UFOVP1268_6 [uncultured Caudovirales phage]CAB4204370.1 hypothetical protein UFOVP1395_10 [uncultured Caudovirales phage]